jgi:DeoR family transcriptional regulator, carbon catabolite repression regulator
MLKEERFNHILKVIKKKGKVFYETLADDLNISEDTVRRDIESLHNNGLLFKVRGGAIPISKNPLSFQDRSNYLAKEKELIALKAQQLIKKGQTIFMDGGSTNCAIASFLPSDARFRLVTNNMALIPIITNFKGIELIILGGIYNPETAINTGGQTCNEVKHYIASLYFMGTCALQKDFGISAVFQNDGEVKKTMLGNAKKTYALANSTNLNTTGHYKVCDMADISGLITDLSTDDSQLDDFRDLGIRLL